MDRIPSFWPMAVASTLAACAASAAEPASGANITDAQFDAALAVAERQGPVFTGPLQSVAVWFREIPVSTEPGKPVWHKLTLNARGKKFDAVRFRVPEGEARGMAWAFIPPANLSGWYIIPTPSEMTGFQKFLPPKRRQDPRRQGA